MLPPTATTGAAGNLTDVAATLVGTVNANGAATTVSFAYGTSPSYGSTVTATPAPVTGTRNTTVTAAVSGLAPGTTYHYRVTATNSVGTTHGTDRTFTTETPAYLSALAVSEGVLSPAFAPTTISYWVQVPPATATIRLTAQTEDAGATIRVQGVELASGATTEPIALAAGGTQITVGVTAAGSTFAKNYVVTVTRPMESSVVTSASSTAIPAPAFDATGLAMEPSLGYAPTPGTNLWLVNNTGLGFIQGEFAGLSQGQLVSLAHNGISYRFVANYFGGTGNDLVLEWAYGRLVGWGSNYDGMLGEGTTATRLQPVPVATDGALAGKTVVRVSLGGQHALALCSDGTLAAWGDGSYSQLGNGSNQDSYVPVAVNQAGVLAGKRVIAIAAGNYHNLVLCSDGTLAAWGWNNSSRLGNGAAVDSNVPVLVDRSGVLAGKTVVAIAAGGSHSLVLCADGTLAAWGSNYNGTLGNYSTTSSNVPVLVDQSGVLAGKTVTAISAGDSFNLVACSDGTAAAWGNNNQGQLGDGTQANRMVPVLVDRSSVLAGRSVTAVGARGYYDGYWGHALCSDGTIAAWGSNGSGQLGTGTTTASFLPTAVVKTGALSGRTPVAAFGGSSSSYALASDGVIAAWGYNVNGQLGNGTTTNSLVPVAVTGLGTDERFHFATAKSASVIARTALPPPPVVVTAAASAMQDTGAKLNGSVSAQGSTTAVTFEYGLTTAYGSTAASSPASVTGSATTAVSATLTGLVPGTTYHYRVTATSAGGRISGENQTFTTTDLARLTGISLSEGQLSPEFAASRTAYLATVPNTITGLTVTPVTADAGSTVTVNGTAVESGTASGTIALAVGHTNLSVVVTAAGGVTTRTYTIAVTRLPASFTFASAGTVPVTAAGFATGGLPVTLGLGFAPNAGTTLTVVNNTATEPIRGEFSNLADGQRVEVSFSGISYPFIVDYFGGTGNDLVLRWGNNRLLAWGRNLNGQLGNNSLNNSNLPVAVDMSGVLLGKTVSAVAAGAQSGFALTTDGRVAAWGGGILGNNDWGDRTAPVAVSTDGALDGRRLRAFSGRHDHVLGLCTDGTVVAWGDNDYGKASGNAEVTNLIPTELAALGSLAGRRVIAVAAGAEHSLALCADGALGTWGYNGNGQLGNDQNSDNPVPQAAHLKGVLAGKTVVSAACGSQHTLALCADGTLAAWGYNGQGQLGDGTTTYRLVPVAVNRSGVLAGKTVTAIAAGWDFSLALCSDGTLASWGYGAYGQLGNGSNSTSSLPVLVTRTGVLSGKTVTQIACGQYHSLALCSDGAVAAWGANDTGGPLGNGSNSNSSVPVLVNTSALKTGERFVAVAAGGMHSLALVASPPPPAATTLAVSGI
ncbi:MAG: cadherin-like beta sandwich domain-containing protein, partial [Akkermansiaceae bacterium]|nr:cadherin-like beta sandwich domain-containing protein [Akkermansiaceae bacterium]